MNKRRVTVQEAAEHFGISPEAVRMRIKRGTLEAQKVNGRVHVLLDTDPTPDPTPSDRDRYISSLEDQIAFLRRELERKDAIMLRMAERIPELEAPQEPRESPSEPAEPSASVVEATGEGTGLRASLVA